MVSPKTVGMCIKKISVRNYISLATISTFLYIVLYAIMFNPVVLENPLVTFVLGTFAPVVMMVYTFYYRKNKTKREYDEWEGEDNPECPCCGRPFKSK